MVDVSFGRGFHVEHACIHQARFENIQDAVTVVVADA